MRKILGFGVVLVAAYLTGSLGAAYAQTGAAGQAGRQPTAVSPTRTTSPSSLVTAPNNLQQQANERAGVNRPAATTPAVPGQTTPAAPGQTTPAVPAPGTVTTTPANTYQAPGTTGTVVNPAGTVTTYPGTPTYYSSNYYQAGSYPGTYTGATPGYTNRNMPGMAGYNSVNPMATTMAPGYYYAGTGGMPYATYNTPGYAPTYSTTGYYPTQPYGYTAQPRRGLFGGMFRRRNRVTYPATTYGYPYGTTPSGYTTYSNTTYYTAPGTYVYGASPY
jgi:hypothetical protein